MATYAEPAFERRSSIRRRTEAVTDRWSLMARSDGRCSLRFSSCMRLPHFRAHDRSYAAQHGVPAAAAFWCPSLRRHGDRRWSQHSGRLPYQGGRLAVDYLPAGRDTRDDSFWSVTDPGAPGLQQGMFTREPGHDGRCHLVAYFGAGPWAWTGVQGGDSGRFQIEDLWRCKSTIEDLRCDD